MFNIRFHIGSQSRIGLSSSCCHEWYPANHIKRGGFVSVWRKSRWEFCDRIPYARRFRGCEPSSEASPAWFLLSDLPSSPADLSSRSCTRYACLDRLESQWRLIKRTSGLHPKNVYILMLDGYPIQDDYCEKSGDERITLPLSLLFL